MRASKEVGGEAADWAIYGQKGSSPRGHDHRSRWFELFDTCMTNTSTLEATFGPIQPQLVNIEAPSDHFSHEQVSTFNARHNGIGLFYDCLGLCRFVGCSPKLMINCLNATTGWNYTLEEAFTLGRRIVNLLRVFSLSHGMDIKDERPSVRYGSIPVDGPNKGVDIMEKWDEMVQNYYTRMGWDPVTGAPLAETLKALDLSDTLK